MYLQDLDKDTLLFAPKLTIDLNLLSLRLRKVSVNTAQLDNGKFFLKRYEDGKTNLQFIINYFDSGEPKPKAKPSRGPFEVTFDKIVLNNTDLRYRNFANKDTLRGVNFNDVHLFELNATVLDLDTRNHLFKAGIRNMSFREKSGFYLKNLRTDATIDSNLMEFKGLLLQTPQTTLRDYLLMKYTSFKDFSDFINKVYVKTDLKNASLYSGDITYFSEALRRMNVSLALDGRLSGYVRDIQARNFTIKAGQATYIRGNFDIKGLPAINKTYLNLNASQLATNKRDADFIIKGFTGRTGVLPEIANRLGNINFSGQFKGLIKNFSASGEFKTALGRLLPDVKINFNGTPSYSGTVRAVDFHLGKLLEQKNLGRTSFHANIKGKGFRFEELNEDLDVKAGYFDFNGYRYNNISIGGALVNRQFDGDVRIADRNLNLDFSGAINLRRDLPEFNFKAAIRRANLHSLGLTKDTLQAEADFHTNFTGDNLNNIQGELELRQLRLTGIDSSTVVDSVSLTASGLGSSRLLAINSDILEANIRGEYDLNTLPSYFKSIVKKYVPSLQANIIEYGEQNFNFYLRLKDFKPISMLFVPGLNIPDGAVFYGRFISAENVAALNGSSPLIEYGKIRVHNFIIDESAAARNLNLFLTADRIDITDSLYIKNINIANILYNDSLALNIKLSDKDATNQLDLNGLIEFGTDTLAKLSILPSDFIINHEVWRVPEQVKFRFDKGRVFVQGFELNRNDQLLTVDGIISANPEEQLRATFKNFQLTTLNPLTRGAGVELGGELNGSISLTSVLKQPKIESEIKADSLVMNNRQIGDLRLIADLDNETKLVNVDMDITKEGEETLRAKGTYDASAERNTLNLNLQMDDNELVIFQPVIRHLVSDLGGTVSADLQVTGNVLDPQINGNLSLNNARLTVNYLQTPYRISDEVRVENSVIHLDDLELTDTRGNKATANGTVDMRNPGNPDIDVSLRASQFMALNTTAKDNPIYYGTAYATGLFRFKGPTNNMRIDINARTEEGTVFTIPLNASETVGNNDFITFVAKDSTFKPESESFFLRGLVLNFDLIVDESSEVNIITNLGRLNGRGSATLNLKITSQGDFEMYGDYLISSGKFQFTAQDFINKIFDLSQGGSIRWTGDPTEALINLKAVYGVRTDVRPLYLAAGRAVNEGRVLAEAIMNLSGNLTQPDISFDIDFPSDAYIKDELQSYFNDVNNKNTQALSLIVRRSFSPNSGTVNVQAVNSTLFSAGTELFFNQLNNILAQSLNLNFVDLNIRSLNEASASLRLLEDRLVITGGVTDRRAELNDLNVIGNSVARDVELQYLLRKDGSLIARASNRLNNRNFLNPDQDYVSALGLVYRQDFENFNEFLRALVGRRRREERRRSETPANPASSTKAVLPSPTEPTTKRQSR